MVYLDRGLNPCFPFSPGVVLVEIWTGARVVPVMLMPRLLPCNIQFCNDDVVDFKWLLLGDLDILW